MIKRILLFIITVIGVTSLSAQAPDMFKYQGVARDNSGGILANQNIGLKVSILENSSSGTVVFSETHNVTTNSYGLFDIRIGNGTNISGSISSIDWENAPHFIQVEMDASGGSSYQMMGTSQLLSVPYALNAASSAEISSGSADQTLRHNGSSWVSSSVIVNDGTNVGINTSSPSEDLEVSGNVYASGGDFYTSQTDGVINCGGGIMDPLSNYIGDTYTSPTIAAGDEDLYINDDLELGDNAYKPGGGSFLAPSDRRLKENIQPFSDGLDEVMKINPVKFTYNEKYKQGAGEEFIGVIAQDMKDIAPYTVEESYLWQKAKEDENGNETIIEEGEKYYTFNPSAINYMLINAVKEQQNMIDTQKEQIEKLQNQMKQQRQAFEELLEKVENQGEK